MPESFELPPEANPELRVAVQIKRLDLNGVNDIEEVWKPSLTAMGEQDAGWPWRAEFWEYLSEEDREMYQLIDSTGRLHAVSSLCLRFPARLERGLTLVYVEWLAVAPWNRAARRPTRELLGCGAALVDHAINRSLEVGCKGRLGLHSLNDPHTEGFYRRCGMTDLGVDPDEENLRYFEFSKGGVEAFRARRP